VPDRADPDPYGFLALEREGLAVREAGTRRKASRDSFHFAPAPSSPLFGAFRRDGEDPHSGASRRSSWRASSVLSTGTMTDTATQTDQGADDRSDAGGGPPPLPSRPGSAAMVRASMSSIPELEHAAAASSIAARLAPAASASTSTSAAAKPGPPPLPARPTSTITPPMTPTASAAGPSPVSPLSAGSEADDEDDGEEEGYASAEEGSDDEFAGYGDDSPVEIVALPVATATAATATPVGAAAHPRLVTVVKPPPPALPPRNPVRARRAAAAAAALPAGGAPAGDGPTSAPSAAPPAAAAAAPSAPSALSGPEALPSVWADDANDATLLGGRDAMRQRAESAGSSVYSAHGRQTTGVVGDQAGRPQANAAGSAPGLAI
jgi:hypothetical protein